MSELLESYLNGNISHVRAELVNGSFSDLFNEYLALDPSPEDLRLFVQRLQG